VGLEKNTRGLKTQVKVKMLRRFGTERILDFSRKISSVSSKKKKFPFEQFTEFVKKDTLCSEWFGLNLITAESKLFRATGDESKTLLNSYTDFDPFWGFFWPGGQAVARFILENPDSTVRGKTVLDLGCGCGAGVLASLISGAKSVTANDIDPLALKATQLNLEMNGFKDTGNSVTFTTENFLSEEKSQLGKSPEEEFQVLLIGDMLYDSDIGSKVKSLALKQAASGKLVLVGDPGRWVLNEEDDDSVRFKTNHLIALAKYDLTASAKSENVGFQNAYVYQVVNK